MNLKKWAKEKDPVRLSLKLAEEVGEVAAEVLEGDVDKALLELDHAYFIHTRLRMVLRDANGR